MTRMIRKQVYIRPEQKERLKRRAQEKGISESELIREGIDEVAGGPSISDREKAWQELLAFMK